tara:strand:- start:201 stop:386 length:186 start_codon:yes stop_codon:yes gene_type:complete
MKKTINQKKGANMKKLNLIDLIALATAKPNLFTDKKQLDFILKVKEKMVTDMFNQYKKENA